jgi:hypothetical protein
MPTASLNLRLDRLLRESTDAGRYRDLGITIRALTVDPPVAEKTLLRDATGELWQAGPVGDEVVGKVAQVVWSKKRGHSTTIADGAVLTAADGSTTRLVAETLIAAGGLLDVQKQTYRTGPDGRRLPAEHPIIIDATAAQSPIVRWAAGRIAALRDQREHPHMGAVIWDDRRGGKTWISTVLIFATLIEVPTIDGQKTEGWLITQDANARNEIEQQIKDCFPGWATFREKPARLFQLVNGAKLLCKTTTDDETLQVGRVDVIFANELALMPESSFDISTRGLQDKDGFWIGTTNLPRKKRGNWVNRLWQSAETEAREGSEPAVALLRCPEALNPYADKKARGKIARAQAYARDPDAANDFDQGMITGTERTVCAPMWSDKYIAPLPQIGMQDVTAIVSKRLFGRGFDTLIGGDFQQDCAATAIKLLAPDGDLEKMQFHVVDAWYGGNEDEIIDTMESSGYAPGRALLIGDCSGAWQGSSRKYGAPTSYTVFKRRNWEITTVTQKRGEASEHPKNPDVARSIGQLRKMIETGRVWVSPSAKIMSTSLKKCEARFDRFGNILPKANTKYSHSLDTLRYVIHWCLARPVTLKPQEIPAYLQGRLGR